MLYIIRAHGLRPSTSLSDRQRWTRHGINVEDLSAIATELAALGPVTAPKTEGMLRTGRESPEKLLARLHSRLRNSLKKGAPPVLSLRRYVHRGGTWEALQGHFVTIVRVPEKLPRKSDSFDFTYFDPWGGKKETGRFNIPRMPVLTDSKGTVSCLVADVPKANIGKTNVRNGETTAVVPAVVLGRW
jgi:hypothetical protein